jgi:hypothetical protein
VLPALRVAGADMTSEREHIIIPAQIVVLLRGALYADLRRACEDMPAGTPESHERAGWADVLARLDGARGALDVIGWAAPAEQQDVTVTLDSAMIEALEDDTDLWDWLSRQEKTESAEGRQQARAKADMIERFLAAVAGPPPPAPEAGEA